MKIVVLKTYTADTDIYWKTLPGLGHEVVPIQYDHLPHRRHDEVISQAKQENPDLIIFIGAVEESHGKPILQPTQLQRLREIAQAIHMCGDAGDEPWWPTLELYDRCGFFNVQVTIDGNFDNPIGSFKNGIVKLCPVDPNNFNLRLPWHKKTTFAGLTGGIGHGPRGEMMARMMKRVDVKSVPYGSNYYDVASFMCNCKVIINYPMRGSGKGDHVKARVVETGWAGACLFEKANPHTARWFQPGWDYIGYEDLNHLDALLNDSVKFDDTLSNIAQRFHERVAKEHNPEVFWQDVFAPITNWVDK
jgi:hypothetical protein